MIDCTSTLIQTLPDYLNLAVKEAGISHHILLMCFNWFNMHISCRGFVCHFERNLHYGRKKVHVKMLVKFSPKYDFYNEGYFNNLKALTCCCSVDTVGCNGLICWMFSEQDCRLKNWRVLFRFQEETRRGETHWQCLSDVTLCHIHAFMQRIGAKEPGVQMFTHKSVTSRHNPWWVRNECIFVVYLITGLKDVLLLQ